MKPNRFFRSPLTWIVLGFVAIALIFEAVGSIGGYTEKPTSEIVALVNSNTPLAEVVLTDGEQTIKVTTKETPARKYRATWVETQSQQLVDRLNARVVERSLDVWKGEPAQPNFWTTFLFSILPFLDHRDPVLRDVQQHPGRRQQGARLRQVEGEAREQGHPEDHLQRCRRL